MELTTFIGSLFFLEKCYQIDYTGEPSQKEVLVKVNFHHSWYLVEREREREREGKKSLFVSVPKGKISLQQERQYQGSYEPWRYL